MLNFRAKTISNTVSRYLLLSLVDSESEDRLKTRRELPNPRRRPRVGSFEGPASLRTLGPTSTVHIAKYTEQNGPRELYPR